MIRKILNMLLILTTIFFFLSCQSVSYKKIKISKSMKGRIILNDADFNLEEECKYRNMTLGYNSSKELIPE